MDSIFAKWLENVFFQISSFQMIEVNITSGNVNQTQWIGGISQGSRPSMVRGENYEGEKESRITGHGRSIRACEQRSILLHSFRTVYLSTNFSLLFFRGESDWIFSSFHSHAMRRSIQYEGMVVLNGRFNDPSSQNSVDGSCRALFGSWAASKIFETPVQALDSAKMIYFCMGYLSGSFSTSGSAQNRISDLMIQMSHLDHGSPYHQVISLRATPTKLAPINTRSIRTGWSSYMQYMQSPHRSSS